MKARFYRAFEDAFRGNRAEIKSRLKVYSSVLDLLATHFPAPLNAVDIGCGRGEWLEILRERNFHAQGVDLDDAMLASCRELGLNAHHREGIEFLNSLPADSQVCVSAFHLIEHISFQDLQLLIEQALRVLKPGGVLIMETPNSENIVVGTSTFHLDVSHHKPVPSQLLSFLARYIGFARAPIMRLNEENPILFDEEITLFSVLNGASPDYAVIALKAGPDEIQREFDSLFLEPVGISLEYIATRYHAHLISRLDRNEALLEQILTSRSWKLTEPLRVYGPRLRSFGAMFSLAPLRHRIFNLILAMEKAKITRSLGKSILWLFPPLRSRFNRALKKRREESRRVVQYGPETVDQLSSPAHAEYLSIKEKAVLATKREP